MRLAHGRPMVDSLHRGCGGGALGCKPCNSSPRGVATHHRVLHPCHRSRRRYRRAAQDDYERRLSVGSRAVRRRFSRHLAVRGPPGRIARRSLLSGGACKLRICTHGVILRSVRTKSTARSSWPDGGHPMRPAVRHCAAVARRALHLARCLERVSGLGGRGVRVRVRISRSAARSGAGRVCGWAPKRLAQQSMFDAFFA
jgi:hypothetical protein